MNIHFNLLNSRPFVHAALRTVCLSAVIAGVSFGAVIYDSGVTAISTNPSLQNGRLSRNGVPSQWAAPGAFPGVLNAAVSYAYQAFPIPTSPYSYLQISIDDFQNSNVFASAYENSYQPTGTGTNLGLDVNYLGNAGGSGNYFGDIPRAFQVILPDPSSNNLVVVVNDTSTSGAGLTQPFELIVEGFYDTSFNDTTAPAPEPGALGLSGGGLCAVAVVAFMRRRRAI